MDILVVKGAKWRSFPFYVSFSLAKVLKPRGMAVRILVNGEEKGLRMRLNHMGRAYFSKNEARESNDSCSEVSEDEDQPTPKLEKKEYSVEWASKTNRSHYNLLA